MFLVVLFLMMGILKCDCHYLQKCCKLDQQLNSSLTSCISFDRTENTTNGSKEPPLGHFSDKYLRCLHPDSVAPFSDQAFLLGNVTLWVPITNSNEKIQVRIYPYSSYCLDSVSKVDTRARRNSSKLLDRSLVVLLCPCSLLPCIRMWCPRDMHFNLNTELNKCQNESMDSPNESYGNSINTGYHIQNLSSHDNCSYFVNGSSFLDLLKFNPNVLPIENITFPKHREFCLSYTHIAEEVKNYSQRCERPSREENIKGEKLKDTLYTALYIVGALFLAVTLVIYGLVAELRKTMYATILMNHVACLLTCYIIMTFNKIILPPLCTWICIITAHLIQFSFIAAIFWLNAMCVHISRSFRSVSSLKSSTTIRPGNKFLYLRYSTYVWGATLSVSVITFLADNTELFSEEMRPGFGLDRCWFLTKDKWVPLLYFYAPISVVIFVNLILFTFTVKKILVTHKESKRILNQESKKHIGNKLATQQSRRLLLYTKLFALMGITWVFEVLSWTAEVFDWGSEWYWYLTDAVNALRGLFIFIICCCRKKVFISLCSLYLTNSESAISQSEKSTKSIRDRNSDEVTKNEASFHQMVLL